MSKTFTLHRVKIEEIENGLRITETFDSDIVESFISFNARPFFRSTNETDAETYQVLDVVGEIYNIPALATDFILIDLKGTVFIPVNATELIEYSRKLKPFRSFYEQYMIGNNLGLIKTTDTPPATGKYRGDVATAGTYTNFKDLSGVSLVFTQGELDINFGFIYVVDNVAEKILIAKPIISDNSVTPEQTTFARDVFSYGKNRFDKSTVTVGKYVNATYGNLSDNSIYLASDFIFIGDLQSQFITFSPQLIHVAFYSEKNAENFISGIEYGGETIIVPENAKWLRCSLYNDGMKETFQIENGFSKTNYENFQSKNGIFIEGIVLPAKQENPLPEILIPTMNWLAYGIEYNFYFKSFIIPKIAEKLENYYCSAFGYRGKFMEDKLRVTPTDDFNIYFKVENNKKNSTKNINFKTAPTNSGNGVTRKALVIGDSTINQEVIIDHVADFFDTDVMNLSLIGTRQTTSGNKHEGRSGWTMKNYIEDATFSGVSNPFSSGGTFNFANYLTTTSQTIGANDWVFIQLGINDLYGTALMDGSQTETAINDRLNAIKARLEVIINSIKSHNPNIRIGIIQTFPPAISQDATGNLLNSSFYSLEYYLKKGLAKWWEYLLEFYDNQNKRNARIYLIGANAVIDRENDFATANQNIDQYDSTQVEVQIDDVHPVDGYKQVGDMYIGVIKYFG